MATTQEYALLALRVYNTEPDVRGPLPSGWSVIQELADDAVGFSAGAYLKGGRIGNSNRLPPRAGARNRCYVRRRSGGELDEGVGGGCRTP
jgi:hypothetical protein